jgi:alkylated DNA repair dioxygenase AlkB
MIDGCIVFSISFGAERWFDLEELAPRGPGGVEVQKDDFVPLRKRIKLEAGSALTMEKACQKVFRHRVPPFKTDEMRINITIRQMKKQS